METITATAGKRAATLVLLAWLGSLLACAGFTQSVQPEDRILFTGKAAGAGEFDSGPLLVRFDYRLAGNILEATGAIHFSGGYDSLNVYLLFIDGSGQPLKRHIVYYSGYRIGLRPGDNSFQVRLDIPANAAGFSFSYSAQPVTIRR